MDTRIPEVYQVDNFKKYAIEYDLLHNSYSNLVLLSDVKEQDSFITKLFYNSIFFNENIKDEQFVEDVSEYAQNVSRLFYKDGYLMAHQKKGKRLQLSSTTDVLSLVLAIFELKRTLYQQYIKRMTHRPEKASKLYRYLNWYCEKIVVNKEGNEIDCQYLPLWTVAAKILLSSGWILKDNKIIKGEGGKPILVVPNYKTTLRDIPIVGFK